ncbi:MAG: ABC transporter ATP-binding protein [Chloroflexi bacterium]|nr:ABC transporter ATP-binding protein [Chloroflexota bacterium]
MTDTAIQIENLTRDFGPVRAVDGLSLEVPTGTVFGFLGPNGSGKTTTINMLLGLLEPTEGRATVLGFDVRTEANEIRARSGALLEHPGVYEQLSAEDNLEFYGRIWRLPDTERRERIRELLTRMELWDRRKERLKDWSRGMQQKLALARALMHRPPLAFLDEPTAGLDVMAAAALRTELASLASREGVTIFMTTHNMAEAQQLCGLVGVIRRGRLVGIGHPDELRAATGGPEVQVAGRGLNEGVAALVRALPQVVSADLQHGRLTARLRDEADAPLVVSTLVGAGVQVEEVQRGRASLEDAFLALMEEEK